MLRLLAPSLSPLPFISLQYLALAIDELVALIKATSYPVYPSKKRAGIRRQRVSARIGKKDTLLIKLILLAGDKGRGREEKRKRRRKPIREGQKKKKKKEREKKKKARQPLSSDSFGQRPCIHHHPYSVSGELRRHLFINPPPPRQIRPMSLVRLHTSTLDTPPKDICTPRHEPQPGSSKPTTHAYLRGPALCQSLCVCAVHLTLASPWLPFGRTTNDLAHHHHPTTNNFSSSPTKTCSLRPNLCNQPRDPGRQSPDLTPVCTAL